MTKPSYTLSCSQFQAYLPELMGGGEQLAGHPHLHSCKLCRALLVDLAAIARTARQLLPIEEPTDAVWEHIESAIGRAETAYRLN